MARRRDVRVHGRGPYVLGFRRDERHWGTGFPFEVPAVAAVEEVRLGATVTLLAGDNGTGRRCRGHRRGRRLRSRGRGARPPRRPARRHAVGARRGARARPDPAQAAQRLLPARGDFNVARLIDSGGTFAPDLSLYGDVPLHEQSHGQSFLALASNRFGGEGLYVLDEPEAALSVGGALALLSIIVRAVGEGAQFVIATHSPILLACPGAEIHELGEEGIAPAAYDDLDAVRLTRGFLEAPERYLRAVLDPDG